MATTVIFGVKPKDRWNKVGILFEKHPAILAQLCEQVKDIDESFNFDTLTVKGLLELCGGNIPEEVKLKFRGKNVRQVAMIVNAVRAGMESFAQFMEETTPPESVQAVKLRKGMLPSNIEEAVLWTLKEAYTLNGLEAAHALTVYEYKIARKQVFNDAVAAMNQAAMVQKGGRR